MRGNRYHFSPPNSDNIKRRPSSGLTFYHRETETSGVRTIDRLSHSIIHKLAPLFFFSLGKLQTYPFESIIIEMSELLLLRVCNPSRLLSRSSLASFIVKPRQFSTTRVAYSAKGCSYTKLFRDADHAVADVKSGSTVLSSGFGLCGVAGKSSLCA